MPVNVAVASIVFQKSGEDAPAGIDMKKSAGVMKSAPKNLAAKVMTAVSHDERCFLIIIYLKA